MLRMVRGVEVALRSVVELAVEGKLDGRGSEGLRLHVDC